MTTLPAAARAYIGTPFRHRGRKPTGVDCAGLVVLAKRAIGIELLDFRLYGAEPHLDGLVKHVIAALGEPQAIAPLRLADLRSGDVVVMRYEVDPHHIGIIGNKQYGDIESLTLIHADGWAGRVHEQRMTDDMAERVTHMFRSNG